MIKRTKYALVTSAIMAFAGVAWAASDGAAIRPPSANITSASKAGPTELVAPARVEAEHDTVSLAFDSSGRVLEVRVREGDKVQAGDVVAKLDDRLPRAAVAKATAALAAAQARADAAEHGARPGEVEAADLDLDAAKIDAAERERQATRAMALQADGTISPAQLDAERSAAESARARVSAATARLALLRSGTRAEQRREAVAAVDAAKADLEEARARLAQTELRAPSSGTVLRRFVEPGEQVTSIPPTVVATLADVEHIRLRAEIDESDIARVAVGQRCILTAEALGSQKVSGHVVRVERELGRKKIQTDDPRARVDTRVLEVLVAPDWSPDSSPPLPLGLRGDVHLDVR